MSEGLEQDTTAFYLMHPEFNMVSDSLLHVCPNNMDNKSGTGLSCFFFSVTAELSEVSVVLLILKQLINTAIVVAFKYWNE